VSRTDPTARRPLRRALAVAAVLLVAAVAAHAAGGGPLPSLGALVVPAGLMVAIGSVLTAARPPRWVAVALVLASQDVVHGLLVLSAARSHVHGGAGTTGGTTGAGATSSDSRMLAMHAAAAVATALLLAQGDRVLAWLAAALRPVWQRRTVTVHPVGRPRPAPVVDVPVTAFSARLWVTGSPRRGPPGGVRVASCVTA
jgi:hypothetical protein